MSGVITELENDGTLDTDHTMYDSYLGPPGASSVMQSIHTVQAKLSKLSLSLDVENTDLIEQLLNDK